MKFSVTLEGQKESQTNSNSEACAKSKPVPQTQSTSEDKKEKKSEDERKTKLESNTESKPVTQTELKPVTQTESKPVTQTESKPVTQTESKPVTQTESKPVSQTELKPVTQTELKPVTQTESKPVTQTESKPVTQTESKPVTQTESKPVTQTESKPVTQTESKPVSETESKPVTQTESKPVTRTKAVSQIESTPESKINYVCLKIDLTSAPDVLMDTSSLLIQVALKETHDIFQIFIQRVQEGQHLHYKCPYLFARGASCLTVVVYVLESHKFWYTVRGGGKAAVTDPKGTELSLKLMLNLCDSYLDLRIKDTAEISYCFDVECRGPEEYMMSNLKYLNPSNDTFIIIIQQSYPPLTYVMMCTKTSNLTFPFSVLPATVYSVVVFSVNIINVNVDVFLGYSHSKMSQFRSYMTQNEILELYFKAVRYLSRRPPAFDVVHHFYRNKSPEYFDDIMWNRMGVMHKYDKNWGGDQASTLNQNIKGLFFSTQIDPNTGRPPAFSYYGSVRFHVPSKIFLHQNMNMYFSDFYCHYVNHKVQFVLTLKGSVTDEFCNKRLLLVDQQHNPFLVRVGNGLQSYIYVTKHVTVELFYTEDVPIKALMLLFPQQLFFTRTIQKGQAKSMVIGIPKNKDCNVCNLDCFLRARHAINGR